MNASVHVSISLISTCLRLDLDTRSLPSRKVCGSSSTARRLADNKSANSTNWPCVILLTSLAGIGALPGPILKALSNLVPKAEFARLGTLLMTLDGSVEKKRGRHEAGRALIGNGRPWRESRDKRGKSDST